MFGRIRIRAENVAGGRNKWLRRSFGEIRRPSQRNMKLLCILSLRRCWRIPINDRGSAPVANDCLNVGQVAGRVKPRDDINGKHIADGIGRGALHTISCNRRGAAPIMKR